MYTFKQRPQSKGAATAERVVRASMASNATMGMPAYLGRSVATYGPSTAMVKRGKNAKTPAKP